MMFRFSFDSAVSLAALVAMSNLAPKTAVATATQNGSIRATGLRSPSMEFSTIHNNNNDRDNSVPRELKRGSDETDGITSYVIGGTDADIDEYPYYALMSLSDGSATYTCGGMLIAPNVVLTAAHCADGKGITDYNTYIGAFGFESTGEGAQLRSCTEFVYHDSWIPQEYDANGNYIFGTGVLAGNDFALCKLNEPVYLDEDSVPVELNKDDSFPGTLPADALLTVVGFGFTSSDRTGGFAPILQEADIPFLDRDECNAFYGGIISDTMMCTWDQSGEGAECGGDSGGPVIYKEVQLDGSFRHIVPGLASFSTTPCGATPGIFARISQGMDWIEETVCTSWGYDDFCSTSSGNGWLSMSPTSGPSDNPSVSPSTSPIGSPSANPSNSPSASPSNSPSAGLTDSPSASPSSNPSAHPTDSPSASPISSPSTGPSASPSVTPTESPNASPSTDPISDPTSSPSGCVDDPTFVYRNREGDDCSWVAKGLDRIVKIKCLRRAAEDKSDKTKVWAFCRATCDGVGVKKACEGL
mmetsp:Transcript_7849/g.19485  ORF Transcript_7849/g.19485 Transcript_7849/m.19485 type:complete len:528 (-) Transcript_7849:193-1776(-)